MLHRNLQLHGNHRVGKVDMLTCIKAHLLIFVFRDAQQGTGGGWTTHKEVKHLGRLRWSSYCSIVICIWIYSRFNNAIYKSSSFDREGINRKERLLSALPESQSTKCKFSTVIKQTCAISISKAFWCGFDSALQIEHQLIYIVFICQNSVGWW